MYQLLIILFSFSLSIFAFYAGVIVFRKKQLDFSGTIIEPTEQKRSKVKCGSICLIVASAYSPIFLLYECFTNFSLYHNVNIYYSLSGGLQHAITLLYITLGIFLLLKKNNYVVISAVAALVLTLFDKIYIQYGSLLTFYYDYMNFLPEVIVLTSFVLTILAIKNKTSTICRYKKILKFVPYTLLLSVISPILDIIKNGYISVIYSIVPIVLCLIKFVAFLLIFKSLILQIKDADLKSSEKQSFTKKEIIILISTIILLPPVINLFATIAKTWFLAGSILFAFLLVAILKNTTGERKKARCIGILVSLALSVGICLIAFALPSNDEEFDPGKCGWCDGYGFVQSVTDENGVDRCSHCHGTGKWKP